MLIEKWNKEDEEKRRAASGSVVPVVVSGPYDGLMVHTESVSKSQDDNRS